MIKPRFARIGGLMLTLAAGIAIVLRWYRGADLIYFWDATIPINALAGMATISHAVRYDFWPGKSDVTAIASLPYFAAQWLLGGFISAEVGQRVLFGVLVALPAITMYGFCRKVIAPRLENIWLSRVVCGLVAIGYAFNPFVVTNLWRIFSTHTFAYGLQPLIALCLFRFLKDGGSRPLLLLSVALIAAAPGYGNAAALAAGIVTFYAPLVLTGIRVGNQLRSTAQRLLAVFGVMVICCSWFVIPQVLSTGSVEAAGAFGGTITALRENTAHAGIYASMRLVGGNVTYEHYINGDKDYRWGFRYNGPPYAKWFATNLYVLLVSVGFLAMVARRRFIWLAAYVASLLLSTGPRNLVTGSLFMSCFQKVTPCEAFRDPFDKFGPSLSFWTFVVIGFGLFALANRISVGSATGARRLALAIAGGVSAALIFIAFSIAGGPMLSGAVQRHESLRPSSLLSFPARYDELARAVTAYAPTLALPLSPGPLIGEKWPRGYVGFDPIRFTTYAPILSTADAQTGRGAFMLRLERSFITRHGRASLRPVRLLGFRSVLVRKDLLPLFAPSAAEAFELDNILRKSQAAHLVFSDRHADLFVLDTPVAPPALSVGDVSETKSPEPWMMQISGSGILDDTTSADQGVPTLRRAAVRVSVSRRMLEARMRPTGKYQLFSDTGGRLSSSLVNTQGGLLVRRSFAVSVFPFSTPGEMSFGEIENADGAGSPSVLHDKGWITLTPGQTRPYVARGYALSPTIRVIAMDGQALAHRGAEPSAVFSFSDTRHEISECSRTQVQRRDALELICTVPPGARYASLFLSVMGRNRNDSVAYRNIRILAFKNDPAFYVRTVGRVHLDAAHVKIIASTPDSIVAQLAPGPPTFLVLPHSCYDCGWEMKRGGRGSEAAARWNMIAPAWYFAARNHYERLVFVNVTERKYQRVELACLSAVVSLIVVLGILSLKEAKAGAPEDRGRLA